MHTLKNSLTFVSGSTQGIGLAIARAFVENEARVVVHGRTEVKSREAAGQIGACGAVWGDLSSTDGANDVLAQLQQIGAVEILINNAGIFSVEDFFELPDEEWHRYYQTNVMSLVRLCRALMPGMLTRDRGCIINVSSEAAVKPLPQMIHYSMTKTAMLSISRGLAELTKGTAVRVNSLLPGPTWTGGVEDYFDGLAQQEGRPLEDVLSNYFQQHEPTSLIQRFAQVDEIADAAIFLAKNGAVNGSSLRVEGGIIRAL
jgi:NAD(P)-dependent dehydrogenase (short-subunit alcohol dehydrogenase family)